MMYTISDGKGNEPLQQHIYTYSGFSITQGLQMKTEYVLTENAVVQSDIKKLTQSSPEREASALHCGEVWE